MREAIIARLLADQAVAAIAGTRIFGCEGQYGGLSQEETPQAFNVDGDVLPSLVVQLETWAPRAGRQSQTVLEATYTVAVFAVEHHGRAHTRAVSQAVKASLHRLRGLAPMHDTHLNLVEITSAGGIPETLDPALGCPMTVTRFAVATTERLIAPGG